MSEGRFIDETGLGYNPRNVALACGWLAHQKADWATHHGTRPWENGYSRNKITFSKYPPNHELNHGAALLKEFFTQLNM